MRVLVGMVTVLVGLVTVLVGLVTVLVAMVTVLLGMVTVLRVGVPLLVLMLMPARCLQGELLSPCRCCGSVRCTHHPCLIKWISERGSWACELCYYKYQVIAISTKNPLQVSPEQERAASGRAGDAWRSSNIETI